MDIVFKTNDFKHVEMGKTFIYNDNVYIKTRGYDGTFEAVDLKDGETYQFDDDDQVLIVKAVLNVGA